MAITYNPIIDYCRLMLKRLRRPLIQHCFNKQNEVIDALTKKRASMEAFERSLIFVVPPIYVAKHVRADITGTSVTRKTNLPNANQVSLSLASYFVDLG